MYSVLYSTVHLMNEWNQKYTVSQPLALSFLTLTQRRFRYLGINRQNIMYLYIRFGNTINIDLYENNVQFNTLFVM